MFLCLMNLLILQYLFYYQFLFQNIYNNRLLILNYNMHN